MIRESSELKAFCMGCKRHVPLGATQNFTTNFTLVNQPQQSMGPFTLCPACAGLYLDMVHKVDAARMRFFKDIADYFYSDGEADSGFKQFFDQKTATMNMAIEFDQGGTRH